jgi:CBS domain-containing protein
MGIRIIGKAGSKGGTVAKVRNKMSFDVVTIEASRSVIEAAKRMLEEKKGALPVTEEGKLVGIFTDRDIVSLAAQNETVAGKDVRSVMTDEPVTIGPDQDEDEARQLMAEQQLDRILVTQGDRLVGIISEADLRADEGPLA